MTNHPSGVTVEVVGIDNSERGRSCEEHNVYGSVLQIDTVVPFRHIRILNERKEEEKAIGVFWVTDGVDRCFVGFLPQHVIKYGYRYEGKLAQIVNFHKNSENAAI